MLRAYLLGDMRFTFCGDEISDLINRQCGLLLAYLMLQAELRFTREQLADVLWDTHPPANPLKAIRQEIWALRTALTTAGADPDDYIDVSNGTIGFRRNADYWLDVQELRHCLRRFDAEDAPLSGGVTAFLEILEHYRGDLMPGHYNDWCLYPREALRDTYLCALEHLLKIFEANERWNEAISIGKKILATDPISENTHRALMRCYYAKGDRALALKQFHACVEMLLAAFDDTVAPMEETVELKTRIMDEAASTFISQTPTARKMVIRRISDSTPPASDRLSVLGNIRQSLRDADQKINAMIRDISGT